VHGINGSGARGSKDEEPAYFRKLSDKNSSRSNQIKIDQGGEQAPAKEGGGPAVVWSQQLGVSLGLKSNDDEEFMMSR